MASEPEEGGRKKNARMLSLISPQEQSLHSHFSRSISSIRMPLTSPMRSPEEAEYATRRPSRAGGHRAKPTMCESPPSSRTRLRGVPWSIGWMPRVGSLETMSSCSAPFEHRAGQYARLACCACVATGSNRFEQRQEIPPTDIRRWHGRQWSQNAIENTFHFARGTQARFDAPREIKLDERGDVHGARFSVTLLAFFRDEVDALLAALVNSSARMRAASRVTSL